MFATNLVEAVKSIPFAVSCSQDGFIRESLKPQDENILNNQGRFRLYFYLSIFYIVSGLASVSPLFFPEFIVDSSNRGEMIL